MGIVLASLLTCKSSKKVRSRREFPVQGESTRPTPSARPAPVADLAPLEHARPAVAGEQVAELGERRVLVVVVAGPRPGWVAACLFLAGHRPGRGRTHRLADLVQRTGRSQQDFPLLRRDDRQLGQAAQPACDSPARARPARSRLRLWSRWPLRGRADQPPGRSGTAPASGCRRAPHSGKTGGGRHAASWPAPAARSAPAPAPRPVRPTRRTGAGAPAGGCRGRSLPGRRTRGRRRWPARDPAT